MDQDDFGKVPSATIGFPFPHFKSSLAGKPVPAKRLVVGGQVGSVSLSPSKVGMSVTEAPSASVDVSVPEPTSHLVVAEASAASIAPSQPQQATTVSTSVAVGALAYFVTEELHMRIGDYDYPYSNQDIIDAQLHGITLRDFILWKFQNGVDRAVICGQ